jgi:hypothetical protein
MILVGLLFRRVDVPMRCWRRCGVRLSRRLRDEDAFVSAPIAVRRERGVSTQDVRFASRVEAVRVDVLSPRTASRYGVSVQHSTFSTTGCAADRTSLAATVFP